MILGKKTIIPTMAAAMAHTKTAAAPRSFMSRFLSSRSAFTKSAVRSNEELMISAANTIPITMTIATHSQKNESGDND